MMIHAKAMNTQEDYHMRCTTSILFHVHLFARFFRDHLGK